MLDRVRHDKQNLSDFLNHDIVCKAGPHARCFDFDQIVLIIVIEKHKSVKYSPYGVEDEDESEVESEVELNLKSTNSSIL